MFSDHRRTWLVGLLSLTLLLLVVAAPPAHGQASPCPPGQPSGRPPGQPPTQPGAPTGRPPQYPPGRCNLQLSKGSVERGESLTASGSGFVPGSQVSLRLASGRFLGFATADANGAFTASITVPADADLGRTQVLASDGVATLSASLEIVDRATAATRPAPSSRAGVLSRTGFDTLAITAVGGSLIVLGAASILAARRRRTTI